MSTSTVKLLVAASEIVGGEQVLAGLLGIDDVLLASFIADVRPLPDPVLIRVVDIVLAGYKADSSVEQSPAAPTFLSS